ncbi:cytosolic carboxypeptidase 2-like [Watersipora subatra]|uniref:cytosolic carboxypeptidase 2-like n=1 Tax=Watersipora subatra TaxID=2589382 RepID=UPI00355C934E
MSDSDDSSQWTEDDGEEDEWKSSVKTRMEEELAKRVADALPETPPLERLRKRQEAARRAQEFDPDDLNAHLDFSEEFYLKREQETISQIKGRLLGLDVWEKGKRVEEEEPEEEQTEEGTQMKEVTRQYQFYEPRDRPAGVFQHFGVVASTSQTSFDANSLVPLLPHPKLEHIIPAEPEPLYSSVKYVIGSRTYENQVTPFTHKLRGSGIVYDSQKSPKVQKVEQPTNPLIAPNLVFESRFESGNLRQARRVNQFEYELVLKTDMFTKRHTQWYYFRVQNMVPGIIYKFRIVNLLKKDSLYNYGMRPLMYSEQLVIHKRQGWIRHGHHISYGRNVQHLLNTLLNREMAYYELEWQLEFPYRGDTCYFAHCYPFSHSDLKIDLASLTCNNRYKSYLKQEVMCTSRAGHECYLLTITNFEKTHCNKKCIVVSGRVHPGESNSSWMMKGLYEFLISDDPDAKELRDRFVFKIIPMLNPDGVIVGNYRCSLQARDLNRNYRWPSKDRFPTIWHVKNLVESLQQESGVFVYCDFHGHSRRANVFMYGNSLADPSNPDVNGGTIKDFLSERMLPFMISQLDPEMFNFQGSRFAIRKCKESTGRVVMFRQHNIANSFTMEATFSGTKIDQDGARHYNQQDFMDAGALFARGVLRYSKAIEDKEVEAQAFLQLAKDITQQVLNNSIKRKLITTTKQVCESQTAEGEQPEKESTEEDNSIGESAKGQPSSTNRRDSKSRKKGRGAANNYSDEADPGISVSHAKAAMEQLKLITDSNENSLQECFGLLENLSIVSSFTQQSESSDSDSESEPEVSQEKPRKKKKKNKKKKDNKKAGKTLSNISDEYVLRNFKPAATKTSKPSNATGAPAGGQPKQIGYSSAPPRQSQEEDSVKLAVLPAIKDQEGEPTLSVSSAGMEDKARCNQIFGASLDSADKLQSGFANPYQHRSNGGIPCYSEERSLERAAKKMAELQKKVEEKAKRQHNYHHNPYNSNDYAPEFDLDLQELNALKLEKKHVQDSFNKSIRMLTQSCIPDLDYYRGKLEHGNIPSFESNLGDMNNLGDLSNLHRRKHKSLTPINGPSRDSNGGKWQWYPQESTHARERNLPGNHKSRDLSQKGMPPNVLVGTRKQAAGKPAFPPVRLGPAPRAPQASRLKNSLRVNPLHYQHGCE